MTAVLTAAHSAVDRSNPLSLGLLHCLPLDDYTARDLVTGIYGTPVNGNATGLLPTGRGTTLATGSGQHITTPFVEDGSTKGWTVSCIVRGIGNSQVMVARDTNTGSRCWTLSVEGSKWQWVVFGGPGAIAATGPASNVAYHVLATWKPGLAELYIDGVRAAASVVSATTMNTNTASPVMIGRRHYSGFNYNLGGTIQMVCIWDRYYSSAEAGILSSDPFQILGPQRGRRTVIILNGGVGGTPAQDIGASTGTITLSGVAAAITPAGGPTIGAATGTITLTGVNGAITSGGANIGSATGTITLSGVAGAISPAGGPTIGAATGTITLTGVPGAISFPATADPNAINFTFRETGHTTTFRERA